MTVVPDRRRSPRVELMGQVRGEVVSASVPVTVREISLGGMSVETPQPFPIGSVQVFILTLGDGAGVEVHARVVYCRESNPPDSPSSFVTGLQFVDADEAGSPPDVSGLINRLT